MKTVFFATALGFIVFSGMVMANENETLTVTRVLDEALCKKLAAAYATDTSGLTVVQIAQLQFCLAHTWGQRPDTVPPTTPVGLRLESQSPSTGAGDVTPPKKPEGLRLK